MTTRRLVRAAYWIAAVFVGALSLLLALPFWIAFVDIDVPGPVGALLVPIGYMLAFASLALGRRARRVGRRNAKTVLETDPRRHILYLRSFRDDDTRGIMEEARLVRGLAEVGPVIAIQRPGERLPPLAAFRQKLSLASWELELEEYLNSATVVVLRIGLTPGILSELGMAGRLKTPELLYLWVGRQVAEDWQKVVPTLESAFGHPLPRELRGARFIVFGTEWAASLFRQIRPNSSQHPDEALFAAHEDGRQIAERHLPSLAAGHERERRNGDWVSKLVIGGLAILALGAFSMAAAVAAKEPVAGVVVFVCLAIWLWTALNGGPHPQGP